MNAEVGMIRRISSSSAHRSGFANTKNVMAASEPELPGEQEL